MFSLNNHSWSTGYDPVAGAAAYQIHPNISAVIGGNATGGAKLVAPKSSFSQKVLGVLLTGNQNVETTKTNANPPPDNTTNPVTAATHKKALNSGSIAAIIGSCVFGLLLCLALSLVFCIRRRQNSEHDEAAEMSGHATRSEMSDEKVKVFELGATEKPLPATPHEAGIEELEGHEWVQEILGRAGPPRYESTMRLSDQRVF